MSSNPRAQKIIVVVINTYAGDQSAEMQETPGGGAVPT